jgi:hypothetical protein
MIDYYKKMPKKMLVCFAVGMVVICMKSKSKQGKESQKGSQFVGGAIHPSRHKILDRFLRSNRIWEHARISKVLESAALNYSNIEYVKVTVDPPDESKSDETSL